MKIKLTILYLMSIFLNTTIAQVSSDSLQEFIVEGKIIDRKTRQPIPYVAIYNKNTGRGTLSNLEGYFKLKIYQFSDTVSIQCIGYKTQTLTFNESVSFYTVKLNENVQVLQEVSVMPNDYEYLYALLKKVKKSQSSQKHTARFYYELKSYVDQKQVELVECFYNGDISGYNLNDLNIKLGRAALQENEKQFFLSVESSRAITSLKLFDYNEYFPTSPFQLSKRELKKIFKLRPVKHYENEDKDSVIVIKYSPRDARKSRFSGEIWVNETQSSIIKTTLNCTNCKTHPFIPLFPDDTIASVNLNITKTFEKKNDNMVFKHIDFSYDVVYKGRKHINRPSETCTVSSNAVLYAYDYETPFFDPKFDYPFGLNDYKKLNIVPYNAVFWDNHNELSIEDPKNDQFFNDELSLTNTRIFSRTEYFKNGILEFPFITWTGKRVFFREFNEDTISLPELTGPDIKKYLLSVKIYLDIIQSEDSLQIITATIFDPYESYYTLPMNRKAQCFVNLYFDLVEIERRALQAEIDTSDKTIETILDLYENRKLRIEKLSWRYFKAVDRGENESEMIKWNDYVLNALKIDNITLFNPYPEKPGD